MKVKIDCKAIHDFESQEADLSTEWNTAAQTGTYLIIKYSWDSRRTQGSMDVMWDPFPSETFCISRSSTNIYKGTLLGSEEMEFQGVKLKSVTGCRPVRKNQQQLQLLGIWQREKEKSSCNRGYPLAEDVTTKRPALKILQSFLANGQVLYIHTHLLCA